MPQTLTPQPHDPSPNTKRPPRLWPRLASSLGALSRRWTREASTGMRAERLVAVHLRRHGYRILARNLRTRIGEIDIVAEAPDGRTIAVVEVKGSASNCIDPPPEAHVNAAKQRKLTSLACLLVQRHRLQDRPIRFDVAGVNMPPDGEAVIRYYEGAFESKV
jgi:putative endonuclease